MAGAKLPLESRAIRLSTVLNTTALTGKGGPENAGPRIRRESGEIQKHSLRFAPEAGQETTGTYRYLKAIHFARRGTSQFAVDVWALD
jgi:hypothetical protein